MKNKILNHFLLVLFFLTTTAFYAPQWHPIHISISEVKFNSNNKSLEITHKIFVDDLEKIIEAIYKVKLHLATDKEHKEAEKYIKAYLDNHFSMSINGKNYSLKFIGKEYETEAIWLFAEVENIKTVSNIEVNNTILLDLYDDQSNFVHFNYLTQKKSLRFREGEQIDKVYFEQ